jgi:threonylcarbamoyladenosine tRNA methylthiotransferase MtaB
MVGFPGETDEDFSASLKIINEIKFLKVHVFPYSLRNGTRAAAFFNQIDSTTKIRRVKKVIQIAQKISFDVKKNFIGKKMKVLYEKVDDNSNYFGYTYNYILVKTFNLKDIRGKILETTLTGVENKFCTGKL